MRTRSSCSYKRCKGIAAGWVGGYQGWEARVAGANDVHIWHACLAAIADGKK